MRPLGRPLGELDWGGRRVLWSDVRNRLQETVDLQVEKPVWQTLQDVLYDDSSFCWGLQGTEDILKEVLVEHSTAPDIR